MRGEKKKRHLKDSTIGIEWELGKKYQIFSRCLKNRQGRVRRHEAKHFFSFLGF